MGETGVGGGTQQRPAAFGGDFGQPDAEQQIGELGLTVSAERGVALFRLQIAEVDLAEVGRRAGHVADPGLIGLEQQRQQPHRQGERAEEVGAEL